MLQHMTGVEEMDHEKFPFKEQLDLTVANHCHCVTGRTIGNAGVNTAFITCVSVLMQDAEMCLLENGCTEL